MTNEHHLLHEYSSTGSQELFRRLVDRYIDLVYTAAKRQVHDAHLAEDVTQAVFLLLARKAGSVPRDRPLSGWLHRTACYLAANARRADASRRFHEHKASQVNAELKNIDTNVQEWQQLSPLLDEGLSRLKPEDRDVILLKFFDRKTHREIGDVAGVSEEAAAKRVQRAIERLREYFRARGVTSSCAVITTYLGARAVEAAPAGLSAAVASGSISTGAALLKGAIFMSATQKAIVAVAAAVVVMFGVGGAVLGVKALLGQDGPAAQAQNAPAPAPAGKYPLKFSDGTIVELLAISDTAPDKPEAPKPFTWWAPDGLATADPQFQMRGGMDFAPKPGSRALQFILETIGPMNGKSLRVLVDSTSSGFPRLRDNRKPLIKVTSFVPIEKPTVDLRVGIAHGAWNDIVMWDKDNGAAAQQPEVFKFVDLSEKDGQTVLELRRAGAKQDPDAAKAQAGGGGGVGFGGGARGGGMGGGGMGGGGMGGGGMGGGGMGGMRQGGGGASGNTFLEGLVDSPDFDLRITLRAGGRILTPNSMQSDGNAVTMRFQVPKDQVQAVLFGSRPYEWMQMSNVSTAPADNPTSVQVQPVTPGTPTTF
jgi:RNA polymerase sigma factor (sigma-70 family)